MGERRPPLRGALAALCLWCAALLALGAPAFAAPPRQVVLVLVPELSYGRALADPALVRLARAGGLGLLTTAGGADVPAKTALGIAAGRPVRDAPSGEARLGITGAGIQVDLAPFADRVGPEDLGLLGTTLAGAGLRVGYADPGSGQGDATAAIAAMDGDGRVPLAWFGRGAAPGPEAEALDADLVVGPSVEVARLVLERTDADDVLVIVAGAGASPAMRERGDTVDAIVLARGAPEELLDPEGGMAGLTSETTRRGGVVAEADVAPTVLGFLGVQAPPRMLGSPIRVEGEPPTELHRRFLDLQEVVGPVGLAGVAFGLAVLAVGLALLSTRRGSRRARPVAAAMVVACSLLVAMLPGSWLPSFRPVSVGAGLVGITAVLAGLALARGGGDPRRALATVGALGLALVGLDALLGWRSELTPLLGGGVLDGERFSGLGNAYAGIVVSGALLAAARLRPRRGLALLVVAAALAGLPTVGADAGGCLTLAAAAALWVGLPRWRLGPRTWALVVAALAAGALWVAIAGRLLADGPTHLSRLGGGEAVLVAFVARLLANVRATSETPAAWLMVLGLGLWLALALRPPAALRPALEADPRWRDAVTALAFCGLLGWILNDTYGLAGSAFTFTSAAILAPALARSYPTSSAR